MKKYHLAEYYVRTMYENNMSLYIYLARIQIIYCDDISNRFSQ